MTYDKQTNNSNHLFKDTSLENAIRNITNNKNFNAQLN
jgi:hypothetical protein